MAIATLFGLIVAIGGLVLIWRTLSATKKAATSASDTLEIAEQTLAASKEATRAELQPYIYASFKEGAMGVVEYDEFFEIQANVVIEIENKGATPAKGLFMNFGGICSIPIINSDGKSSTLKDLKQQTSTLGRSMLGAGESYCRDIRLSFRMIKSSLEGTKGLPDVMSMRLSLALRLSFTDDFIPMDKDKKRYGRRVMEFEFGDDCIRDTKRETPFLRDVPAKDVDYPHEHNKRQGNIFPHVYYSSGALNIIKAPEHIVKDDA